MKKIKRKDFFKGIAISTISLPFLLRGCGGDSFAQHDISAPNIITGKKYQWKMVTTWPPNFPVLGEACNHFAKWVSQMTNGRMEIKVFGGGELVPALETFDTVKDGNAEMGNGAAYYWAGKIPAAQFFASVPFGMNAQQMNAWLLGAGGMQLWEEVYAPFNLVPMMGGNTGVQMGGWFNKEINTIDDFKGLKMRIPGLGGKVLNKAGGTAVLSPGSELYTNLERGIIDATEWIGPYHDYKMGFQDIAKYYYSPGWHEAGSVLEYIVNKEKYDRLAPDLQSILQTAAQRANAWVLSEFEAKNSLYLTKILKEGKVQFKTFPKEVLHQLGLYTKEVLAEFVSKDALAKKVYTSYNAYRTQAIAWAQLTEKVFYNDLQI